MIRYLHPAFFITLASWLPAAPAVPLVNLVDDQTLFALSVTDTPALLRGWDASPLAATWNDPQVVKFLLPLRGELKVDTWDEETKEATGMDVRELLALAEGEALVALPGFNLTSLGDSTPPPFLIALEVGGQGAKIEKLIADSAAKKSRQDESEVYAGVTVNLIPVTPSADTGEAASAAPPQVVAWAIVDGIWVLSPQKERVFLAIDAIKQGGVASALGKSDGFLRTRERIGAAQTLAYVNFPAVYPLLQQAVVAAKAKNAGQPNVMGLDFEVVFNALGLDAVGETYVALLMSETETRVDAGFVYKEDRGLLRLLAYQPGPVPQPEWIPAKWPSVSLARFSLPKAYAALETLVESISPMLSGMAQGQIRTFNKKLGIDVKRDLIGSIGDDVVSAYAIPPGVEAGAVPPWNEMDQLFAFSLVNEPAFLKSVEALKQLAGPDAAEQMFTKRDYLGYTLYTLNVPAGRDGRAARGFTYAIANRTLLLGVGSPATVENALQGMASPKDSYWQRADVKAVLGDVPPEASGVQVQDLSLIVQSLIETAVQVQELANQGRDKGEAKTYVDLSARPDAETIGRYWGLSAGYVVRTSEGLFSTTRIAHPQQ